MTLRRPKNGLPANIATPDLIEELAADLHVQPKVVELQIFNTKLGRYAPYASY